MNEYARRIDLGATETGKGSLSATEIGQRERKDGASRKADY